MMGVFVALDFFLFFVFWEVMLLPMYFLIGIWGGPRREYAAIKFFLYTLVGSVLMLLAILALYFNVTDPATGQHTFDMTVMMNQASHSEWLRSGMLFGQSVPLVLWIALFIGFAIKIPAVPVPHLAARRARRGADGDLRHPGRRAAEDGHLRDPAHQLRASSRRRRRSSPSCFLGVARRRQHRLRGAVRDGADGSQEAGRLLARQPHGLRHARHGVVHRSRGSTARCCRCSTTARSRRCSSCWSA